MTTLFAKPTDEELEKGRVARQKLFDKVNDFEKKFSGSEQIFSVFSLRSEQKQIRQTLDEKKKWLEKNVQPLKRDVDPEDVKLNDIMTPLLNKINETMKLNFPVLTDKEFEKLKDVRMKQQNVFGDFQMLFDPEQKRRKAQQEEEAKKQVAPENRTAWDDMSDAAKWAVYIVPPIIFLFSALFIGSYVANATLYRPIPYRILNIFYGILFSPFLFLYYIYFIIRAKIFPNIYSPPLREAFFPLFYYKPKESDSELSFAERFFGIPETESLLHFLEKKKEEERVGREKALLSTVYESLVEAEKLEQLSKEDSE